MRFVAAILAVGLSLALACSSIPDVQYVDSEAGTTGASTSSSSSSGGTSGKVSSGSSSGSSGSSSGTPTSDAGVHCPDKPPPASVGVCCGTMLCLKCKDAQCSRCLDNDCGDTNKVCCARSSSRVDCTPPAATCN